MNNRLNPTINFLSWNCNSLNETKINSLELFLSDPTSPIIHVIALLEAHTTTRAIDRLKKLRARSYTIYPYSCPTRRQIPNDYPAADDRTGIGGGIIILIHNTLFAKELLSLRFAGQLQDSAINESTLESKSSDIVWFDLDYGEHFLRFGAVYLHSENTVESNRSLLNSIRSAIDDHHGPVLIAGDFNYLHQNWEGIETSVDRNHNSRFTNANAFITLQEEVNLILLNTSTPATRFVKTHANTRGTDHVLDLALTTDHSIIADFQILYDPRFQSDHRPLFTQVINESHQQQLNAELLATGRMRWRSDRLDTEQWELFSQHMNLTLRSWFDQFTSLSNTNYLLSPEGQRLNSSLIESAWTTLSQLILITSHHCIGKSKPNSVPATRKCYSDHAGEIRIKLRSLNKLRNLNDRARFQYQQARDYQPNTPVSQLEILETNSNSLYTRLRGERNELNKFLKEISRQEYADFLRSIVDPDEADPQLAWSLLKRLNPANSAQLPTRVNHPITGAEPKSAKDSLENLAIHYAGVCQFDEQLLNQRDSILTDQIHQFTNQIKYSQSNLTIMNSNHWPAGDQLFTCEELNEILDHLNVKKAFGPDDIDGYMLRYGGSKLREALLILYNACWVTGVIPNQWKDSNVFPLFKKGSITDPNNYRPISLTCMVSRIYERLILPRFRSFLTDKLHPSQAGFRQQHSTADNLYRLTERIYYEGRVSKSVYHHMLPVVFLDLKKAFDKMDPFYLLYKLHHQKQLPIESRLMRFVASFLSNRRLRVSLSEVNSNWHSLSTGTPQGTVLGPILFLIYIDDLLWKINPRPIETFDSPVAGQYPIEALGFADDILLLPADRPVIGTRNTNVALSKPTEHFEVFQKRIQSLKSSLLICADWARNSLMIFSTDKTNSMLFRSHSFRDKFNSADIESEMNQLQLQLPTGNPWTLTAVTEYSYMGILFSNSTERMFDSHCEKILAKLSAAAVPLRRLLTAETPQNIGEILLRSLVLPIAYYGLEFIRYGNTNIESLHRCITNISRDVLHIPHHVRQTDVFLHLNLLPLDYQHEYQLIRFFNRISKYDSSRLTRRVFIENLHSSLAFDDLQKRAYQSTIPYGTEILRITGLYTWPCGFDPRPFVWPGAAGPPQLLTANVTNQPIQSRPDQEIILKSARNYLIRIVNIKKDAPVSALDTLMETEPAATQLQRYRQWFDSIPRIRPNPLVARNDRLQNSLHAFMRRPNGEPPVRGPIPPVAAGEAPKLPNATRERFLKVDRGYISHLRTRVRLDKLPTLSNLQHYYAKVFTNAGYPTACRACSHQLQPVQPLSSDQVNPVPPDPAPDRFIETQSHIFLECKHPFINLLRSRLRRKLIKFRLPITLPILGGQLNTHRLPDKQVQSILKWTGDFIKSISEKFQFSLMKTWVPIFANPTSYLLYDTLPP